MSDPRGRNQPGIAVDAAGGAVIDPTANVIALNEAANKRQDDLRQAEVRLNAAEIAHVKEIAKIRAGHYKELRISEARRLDSVRQVDLGNFNAVVGEIRSALKELGGITTSTATTLQARVDATAATLAKSGADQVAEVMKRIAALELAAAQGIGKQAVSDPQLERLAAMVGDLSRSRASDMGGKAVWAVVGGIAASIVVGLIIVLARSMVGG